MDGEEGECTRETEELNRIPALPVPTAVRFPAAFQVDADRHS